MSETDKLFCLLAHDDGDHAPCTHDVPVAICTSRERAEELLARLRESTVTREGRERGPDGEIVPAVRTTKLFTDVWISELDADALSERALSAFADGGDISVRSLDEVTSPPSR